MKKDINKILKAEPRNNKYGAPLGASNYVNTTEEKLYLQRIVFVDGDYAADGTYWGKTDVPLWCAFSDNNRIYVRASTRSNAISLVQKIHPDMQFYKK